MNLIFKLRGVRAGGVFPLTFEEWEGPYTCNGAFTLDVKLVLNENQGDILRGTQC
jgi:hypothetical protein